VKRHTCGTNLALKTSTKKDIASVCRGMADGRYRMHSGHCSALALNGSVANDPGCVKTSTSAARVEVFLRNCAI
jgi:hypothetical protein